MTALAPRSAAGPDATTAGEADRSRGAAARQLEAFFLRRLLAEARTSSGGAAGLDGGFAGDTFKQMLDESIADQMAAAGGVGLAALFERQLGGPGAPLGPAGGPPGGALPGPGAGSPPLPPGGALAAAVRPLEAIPGGPRFALPVAARVSSGYGLRADPADPTRGAHLHAGIDLAATAGTPVAAAAAGTVVHAGPAGTYGNLVIIRHGPLTGPGEPTTRVEHGTQAPTYETRYAHLRTVDVVPGQQLEAGQAVGTVGSTGHSTGPHLHFEVRRDGQPIDPARLLPLNNSPPRTTR